MERDGARRGRRSARVVGAVFAMGVAAGLAAPPEAHAETAEELLEKGRALQKEMHTREAIDAYEGCLDADPRNADCHWEIGWSYWVVNDWPKVVQAWQRAEQVQAGRTIVDGVHYLAEARRRLKAQKRFARRGPRDTQHVEPDEHGILRNVPIGIQSRPADAPVKLTLVGRFQSYNMQPQNPKDVYDQDVFSPKSARYSSDGSKVWVNSLEGFTTVVYDATTLTKVGLIEHDFDVGDAGLFKETDAYDYEWIARPKEGSVNVFRGKPVESELSHDARWLWVPYYRRDFDRRSQSPSAVAIIDAATDRIVRVMATGPIPKYVRASPRNDWIALSHWGDNTVMLIDGTSKDPASFGYGPLLAIEQRADLHDVQSKDRDEECGLCLRGLEYSRDGRYLFIARMGGGGIAVVDLDADPPRYAGSVFGMKPTPRHLVLSADGRWLYMTCNEAGSVGRASVAEIVAAVSADPPQERPTIAVREIDVGLGARTLDLAKDGRYLVVAVNGSSRLAVVDSESFEVVAHVPVDSYPVGLAVSPDGSQLFVTSQGRRHGGGNSVGVYSITYTDAAAASATSVTAKGAPDRRP